MLGRSAGMSLVNSRQMERPESPSSVRLPHAQRSPGSVPLSVRPESFWIECWNTMRSEGMKSYSQTLLFAVILIIWMHCLSLLLRLADLVSKVNSVIAAFKLLWQWVTPLFNLRVTKRQGR